MTAAPLSGAAVAGLKRFPKNATETTASVPAGDSFHWVAGRSAPEDSPCMAGPERVDFPLFLAARGPLLLYRSCVCYNKLFMKPLGGPHATHSRATTAPTIPSYAFDLDWYPARCAATHCVLQSGGSLRLRWPIRKTLKGATNPTMLLIRKYVS